jgi:cyanophycinase
MKLFSILLATALSLTLQAQDNGTLFLPKGKLIIIGGGDIPDTLFNLFAASVGGKDQPVIVIPTATTDEAYIQEGGHLKKFSSRGFSNLHTIHTRDKKKADDPALIALMRKAKGVYFGGGDQDLIAQAYANTQLHQEMFALLERGGVIMGTSAGATIMGSVLIGGDHRKTPQVKTAFPAGLSFLKQTAIDQHVLVRNRQFDLIPVLEAHPGVLGIAIDESTAAVVSGNSLSVAGKSYVMVYDQNDWKTQLNDWKRVYRPFRMLLEGMVYDLKAGKLKID